MKKRLITLIKSEGKSIEQLSDEVMSVLESKGILDKKEQPPTENVLDHSEKLKGGEIVKSQETNKYVPPKESAWEKVKGHLGILAWAFIQAMGIIFLLSLLTQWTLDALNTNIYLPDITMPVIHYIPLDLLIFLLLWAGTTIYFYRRLRKPTNHS